ncbi:transcriptional regulator family: bZIP [Penicillium angulare]|uniref:Transcriptional regulator family: bZIP n=1 Tax=Penicillium angulare TaxID=116970 RepID=A0A9W9KPI0_9EURO|nr:transcriptional regulator family: bZIP [Penicillium angulare]
MQATTENQNVNPLWLDPTLTLQNATSIANPNSIPSSIPSHAESSQPPKAQPRRQGRTNTSKEKLSPEKARNLERNRIAANKCREKRKQSQANMEYTLETETARNQALVAEVSALKEEIWHLKNQLLDHARCDDHRDPVSSQINGGAQNTLGDSLDPLKCPSPSFSVSTWSDESIVDPGTASKASMDEKFTREFYGDGLFESFVDVPNI